MSAILTISGKEHSVEPGVTIEEAVRAAGLRVEEITRQGEWVCVTAVKD